METPACYFLAGSFKTHHYDVCKKGMLYRELAYVISFAPYYWRAMQVRSINFLFSSVIACQISLDKVVYWSVCSMRRPIAKRFFDDS